MFRFYLCWHNHLNILPLHGELVEWIFRRRVVRYGYAGPKWEMKGALVVGLEIDVQYRPPREAEWCYVLCGMCGARMKKQRKVNVKQKHISRWTSLIALTGDAELVMREVSEIAGCLVVKPQLKWVEYDHRSSKPSEQ